MREKYESLPLVQLKELAKVRGLKGTSTMKKAELVEAMLAEDERLKKEEEAKATEQKQESATETVRSEEPQKQEQHMWFFILTQFLITITCRCVCNRIK